MVVKDGKSMVIREPLLVIGSVPVTFVLVFLCHTSTNPFAMLSKETNG